MTNVMLRNEPPVPAVEHKEEEGEEGAGEDINLLRLELEVGEPAHEPVCPLDGEAVVDDGAGRDHVRPVYPPHQGVLQGKVTFLGFTQKL